MITARIVVMDVARTEFMQAADVFEPFKVLARVCRAELDDVEKFRAGVDAIRKGFEQADKNMRVVAIEDPLECRWLWQDETVKVVSNGTNWRTLDELLQG